MFCAIEPAIYRAVIDDVMSAIRPEFDEYGVAEEVLGELQHVSPGLTTPIHLAPFVSPIIMVVELEMGN